MGRAGRHSQAVRPGYWYSKAVVRQGAVRQTGDRSMTLSDAIYMLFLLICAWLALAWDSEGGGGKRARLPLRF